MRSRPTIALLALAAMWAPHPSKAQSSNDGPTVITLRPAAQPRPALKYRLVPEDSSLVPGNAAVFYHRAILMANEKNRAVIDREKLKDPSGPRVTSPEERIANWIAAPIGEIPRDEARKVLEMFGSPLKEVELGSRRAYCDWGFDGRDDSYYYLPLPEIQATRSLARLVALRARLAILDGKVDEAMHWIETNMVLGRHVSRGPTLIQSLVGVAIDFVTVRCLEELIQVPGAPDLCWALVDRPRPFIDLRPAMDGESHVLEKEIPGLLELGGPPWSVEKARKFADDLQNKLYALYSGQPIPGAMEAAGRRLGIAAMAAKIYPEARKALIAEGRPEAEVEAMPIIQVATCYCYREYRRMLDDVFKWLNAPYWQAHDKIDRPLVRSVEQKMANPLLAMFTGMTPAIRSVQVAGLRIDRQLDALQCVEAIRLDAEAHGGKLPASLDTITEAPIPIDLMTGKPFSYKVEGDSATLSAPIPPGGPDHPSFKIHYVLKLVK